jgi:ABC-2 type transport system ATP-binding protein
MQQRFFDLILEESHKGATVFFSSHILSEVQRLCSRVAIIREGEIITIEDIKTLQKNNYKKISITAENLEMAHFSLEGATNLTQVDGEVKFFFKGDINQVTRLISAQPVADVLIEEPTLEEIFIHYYD